MRLASQRRTSGGKLVKHARNPRWFIAYQNDLAPHQQPNISMILSPCKARVLKNVYATSGQSAHALKNLLQKRKKTVFSCSVQSPRPAPSSRRDEYKVFAPIGAKF